MCRTAVVALALASVVVPSSADDQSVAIVPQVITDTTGYVTLTADDPGGSYSYNTADRWSDHAAPSSGKDYLVQNNYVIRFLTGTFAGRSLTLDNGRAKVNLGQNGTATVDDLRLYGGRIEQAAAGITEYLNGTFHIYGTAANPSRISGSSGRIMKFNGASTTFVGDTSAVIKVMMTEQDAASMSDKFYECWIACNNAQTYAGRFIVSAGNAPNGWGHRVGLFATSMDRFGKGDPDAATSVITLQNRAALVGAVGLQFTNPAFSITVENSGTIGGVQGVNAATKPNGMRVGGGVAIKGSAPGAQLYVIGDSPVEFDNVVLSNIGSITVERGDFRLGSQYANVDVPIDVGATATLGGTVAATAAPDFILRDGVTLSPGDLFGAVGTLGLGSATAQGALVMKVDMARTGDVLMADHVQVNGKLKRPAGGSLAIDIGEFPSGTDWAGSVTLLTATNLGESDGYGLADILLSGFPASWLAVRDTGTLSIVPDGDTKHLVWTCVLPSSAPVLRILPLGDSITYGSGSSLAGYREPLYNLLRTAGYNLDFVGTLQTSAGSPVSDPDHEGHVGWTIADAYSGIDAMLTTLANANQTPHIFLLHIGKDDLSGNDFAHAKNRLAQLVDRINELCPGAWVVMTTLFNRYDDNGTYNAQIAAQFNPFVEEIAASRRRVGWRVAFCDMNAVVPEAELADGVHPNDTGYAHMAAAWFGAITNIAPTEMSIPSATREDKVTLTGTDAIGTSSFSSYLHWSNGLDPRAGYYYFVPNGLTLRTVDGGPSATFAGESLVLEEGSFLNLKHAEGATVTANWVAYGARLAHGNSTGKDSTWNLGVGGTFDVRGTSSSPTLFTGSGAAGSRQTTVSANLIGTEDAVLRVTRTGEEVETESAKGFCCVFTGDNHAYRGRFEIASGGVVKGPFKAGFNTRSLGAPVFDGPKVTIRDNAILLGNGAAFTNGYEVALDGDGCLEPSGVANLSNRYGADSRESLYFCSGAKITGSGDSVLTIRTGTGSAIAFGDVKITGVSKIVQSPTVAVRIYPDYENRGLPIEVAGNFAAGSDGVGPVTVKNGGFIQPGMGQTGLNALGTYGLASLTVEEGGYFKYSLLQIDGVVTSDFIRVYGNITKSCSKIPIVFDAASDVAPKNSRYPLLAAANLGTEITVDDFVWSSNDEFVASSLQGEFVIEPIDGTNTLVFVQSSSPVVKLTGTDTSGNDSWARAGSWDNHLAPNLNSHYVIPSGKLLRRSMGGDAARFGGLSLSIRSGGDFAINGQIAEFDDLRLFSGGILTTRNDGDSNRLRGTATVYAARGTPFNFEIEATVSRTLRLEAALKGDGDIRFRYYHTSGGGNSLERKCTYLVSGDNSQFTGGIELFQSAVVTDFANERAMGGPAPAFRENRLLFTSNATLRCSSSYVMSDPSRGIYFGDGKLENAQDGGRIEVLAGQTLTISNRIAGTTSLRKDGSGTLLFCCATNAFSGTVRNDGAGTIAVGHADALANATLQLFPNSRWRVDAPEGMTVKSKDAVLQNGNNNGVFRVWATALDDLGHGCSRVEANLVRFKGATAADADALLALVQLDEARLPNGARCDKTAVVDGDAVVVKVLVRTSGCTIYLR